MVSYGAPTGQLTVEPRSPEQLLHVTVKAESPTLSQGSSAPQWQQQQTQQNSGSMSCGGQVPGALGTRGVASPHRHSSLSPKREVQQHVERERERDAGFDEYSHDRKRSKVQDSVHTISSQMQSQLLSPRGGPGCTGPALTREASSPASKYSEPQHSCGSICRIPPTPHLSQSTNPLDEPSPLGLTLRKTPSLLDLISMKLAQSASNDQGSANPDALAAEAAKNRLGKCLVPTATAQDKLKASNFPASSLKIGNWERVSRYEGDLVGKCYYAKRKLVWEVLETGLKSKIEIQWSDISAMKASCPENLPGSLEIEVSRPPLFFRETNPQPRKHTLWQATSDFTGGQATVNKRHSLIFPEGVLNRHYEKLVQCDPRLKALVEGTLSIRPSPDFERPMFDAQHQHLPTHQQPVHQSSSHDSLNNQQSYILPQHMQMRPNTGNTLGGMLADSKPEMRLLKMQSSDLASPSSVMDARVSDESGTSDNEDLRVHDEPLEYDQIQADRMDMMYSNEHLEDVKPLCNAIYMGVGNALPPDRGFQPDRKILDQIAHDLLGEPTFSMSNDQALILAQRVGHMSAALAEEFQLPHQTGHGLMDGSVLTDGHHLHHFNPFPVQVKTEMGLVDDQLEMLMPGSGNHHPHQLSRLSHRDPSFNTIMSCINKHGSASDLLMHLPRVATLPQLFETSAQVPLARYDPMRQVYFGSEKLR